MPDADCRRPDVVVTAFAGERQEWDDFVRRTPGGTLFHLIAWKEVLERAFGFSSRYLLARRDGRVIGVLPLFELHGSGTRHCLQSVPFAVEGGVCSADEAAARALERAALNLADALGARSVELRDARMGDGFRACGANNFRFRRRLPDDDAELLATIPAKRRNMIRVGMRNGLRSRTGFDDLPAFYDLHARTLHRLGTPVFPIRYFNLLIEELHDQCVLLTVWHGRVAAAAALAFFFQGTLLPYYVGSRRDCFRYAVNDFMYWELMRLACARGCHLFDFGRSRKGSGAYEFKRHWGLEPEPLRYRIAVRGPAALSQPAVGAGGVELLRRAWRHLPLTVTKLIGPFFLRRYGPHYT
ncbi:MAG TPA: FemAB family XrtA/PEP-CTERM system-associated protein [Candidatus Acidoferrales bacterium]|nr:FemAB family XrtA/PEP-CTERM system-associated protein [Candidatus Acidoferrales bacterium]